MCHIRILCTIERIYMLLLLLVINFTCLLHLARFRGVLSPEEKRFFRFLDRKHK